MHSLFLAFNVFLCMHLYADDNIGGNVADDPIHMEQPPQLLGIYQYDLMIEAGDLDRLRATFENPDVVRLDQKKINELCKSACSNLPILHYLMTHDVMGIPRPDQDGINKAAGRAAELNHTDALLVLMTHQYDDIPRPDQIGIDNALLNATLKGPLDRIDFLMRHDIEGIPRPSEDGVIFAHRCAGIWRKIMALDCLTGYML